MSCRKINDRWASSGFITKEIAWDDALCQASFPNYEEINSSILQNIFNNIHLNKITQQAIIQQYNEIYIYHKATLKQRNILAPQVKVIYSLANLPDIVYPKFNPLIDEKEVWSLNERDLNIKLGTRLQCFGINFNEYKKFVDGVINLCDDFNLCEDDILLNPSNIGYHHVLGLRIIDYGLTNDHQLLDFYEVL